MTRRFWFWFTSLLAFPSLLCAVGFSAAAPSTLLRYFVANYVLMAAPHIVVAAFAIFRRHRRVGVLQALGALNFLLLGFWLWIRLAVPVHESGLAWVLYLPLAGAALVLLGIIAFMLRRRQGGGTVGA